MADAVGGHALFAVIDEQWLAVVTSGRKVFPEHQDGDIVHEHCALFIPFAKHHALSVIQVNIITIEVYNLTDSATSRKQETDDGDIPFVFAAPLQHIGFRIGKGETFLFQIVDGFDAGHGIPGDELFPVEPGEVGIQYLTQAVDGTFGDAAVQLAGEIGPDVLGGDAAGGELRESQEPLYGIPVADEGFL